jgi:hypothetical protein
MFARIENGQVVAYPYTEGQLRADHPQTSFPGDLAAADLTDFGVVAVTPTARPAHGANERAVEGVPILSGEAWVQTWAVEAYVPPVPPVISDRQFFQQLAIEGRVTETEALAAVATGTIPADMEALVQQLPAGSQFGARMLLSGATQFERAHPLTGTLGQMYGMDEAELDQFWRDGSAL